ncbi:troponin C at 41C isoform X1 [Musca autumnalis]|uniref:troponin C at 41C isoform X1 n=1 Tax=Musca autumnalis TaxID=221902 RepID=UPI003CF5C087
MKLLHNIWHRAFIVCCGSEGFENPFNAENYRELCDFVKSLWTPRRETYRYTKDDLNKEQIVLLRNAFNAFDPEKNGYINTQMVGTILSMLGHQLDDATLAEIIAEVDEDGSGQIEFEEFTTLAARFLVEEDAEAMLQELKEAFRLYDKEGNGYITTGVLREILRELDDKLTNEDLDMMIEEIDSDGSGTVDFDEFMEVMTGGDD